MITKVLVQNYALISELELDLQHGMSVITGETGAGKSIILGALRLVLGDRADTKVLFNVDQKCIVEIHFDVSKYKLKELFQNNDLDYFDECIMRREILPSAKSRAFVNDTPVNLQTMKIVGDALVEMHSQNDSLAFKDTKFQFELLDAYVGHDGLVKEYQKLYQNYLSVSKELEELRETEEKAKLDQDYFQFQLDEIENLKLKEGELEQINEELKVANKFEQIQSALANGEEVLSGNDGILEQLSSLKQELSKIQDINAEYEALYNQINSVYLELDDASSNISRLQGGEGFDQERIHELNDRFNAINLLLQKHRLNDESELLELEKDLADKLGNITSLDKRINDKNTELDKLKSELDARADVLHKERLKSSKPLAKEIQALLADMAMEHSEIRFELEVADNLNRYGHSTLNVFFKANPGTPEALLHKAASGGELSRLVLALKSVLAARKAMPTIIFDEIDTGVSGAVASKMGKIMREMGRGIQVLSISHLPQVAAMAQHHYVVKKSSTKDSTHTQISKVEDSERVNVIAQMLSGETLADAAIDTAKDLLLSAN